MPLDDVSKLPGNAQKGANAEVMRMRTQTSTALRLSCALQLLGSCFLLAAATRADHPHRYNCGTSPRLGLALFKATSSPHLSSAKLVLPGNKCHNEPPYSYTFGRGGN